LDGVHTAKRGDSLFLLAGTRRGQRRRNLKKICEDSRKKRLQGQDTSKEE